MQDALFFSRSDEFEVWLEQHHATSDGVWVRMAKTHTAVASLGWASAVEVVLCFGWIDGQSRRVGEDWFVQRFTPRRPRRAMAAGTRRITARGRPPCPKTSPRRSTPPG